MKFKAGSRLGRGACTLVDLSVAVFMASVLALMLFPALSGARQQDREIACLNNLRQLGGSFKMYLAENDDRFPHFVPGAGEDGVRDRWPAVLVKGGYAPASAMWLCPSKGTGREKIGRQTMSEWWDEGIDSLDYSSIHWQYIDYGGNLYVGSAFSASPYRPGSAQPSSRLSDLTNEKMILLAESIRHGEYFARKVGNLWVFPTPRDVEGQYNYTAYTAHDNKCNVLWIDGSAGGVEAGKSSEKDVEAGDDPGTSLYRAGALTDRTHNPNHWTRDGFPDPWLQGRR